MHSLADIVNLAPPPQLPLQVLKPGASHHSGVTIRVSLGEEVTALIAAAGG